MNRAKSGKKKQRDLLHTLCQRTTTTYSGILFITANNICTCGIILTEVLQGIREDEDYQRTLSRFDTFLLLPMTRQAFLRAAELYRSLRRRGVTIRKPVDCMIASVAIEHDIALLHNDRDFDLIETYCGLKVVRVSKKPTRPSRRRPEGRA